MISRDIKFSLEPEGRNTQEVYVQGLSTSLPEDVQQSIFKPSQV